MTRDVVMTMATASATELRDRAWRVAATDGAAEAFAFSLLV